MPRRDWIILPILCIVTVLLICFTVETIALRRYSTFSEGKEKCQSYLDPYLGVARPANCVFRSKATESELTEHRYNSQGFREDAELKPKQPGTYRIVLVGSSYGVADNSPKEKTFATLLPLELSRKTGRRIELYNESVAGFPGLPQNVERRFDDVLQAHPDMVLWILNRWDLKAVMDTSPDPDGGAPQAPGGSQQVSQDPTLRTKIVNASSWLRRAVSSTKEDFTSSRSAILLKHMLAHSQTQLISSSEKGPDDIVGYLKADYSPAWQERLNYFETDLTKIKAKASAANVSLVVVLLPSEAQTAMISAGKWSSSYDPYKLDKELSAIVSRHGATYVEISPEYRNIEHPESNFLIVDGHPSSKGNAVIADFLAKQLLARVTLESAVQPQAETARGQDK